MLHSRCCNLLFVLTLDRYIHVHKSSTTNQACEARLLAWFCKHRIQLFDFCFSVAPPPLARLPLLLAHHLVQIALSLLIACT